MSSSLLWSAVAGLLAQVDADEHLAVDARPEALAQEVVGLARLVSSGSDPLSCWPSHSFVAAARAP